jgi:hypothetical protein
MVYKTKSRPGKLLWNENLTGGELKFSLLTSQDMCSAKLGFIIFPHIQGQTGGPTHIDKILFEITCDLNFTFTLVKLDEHWLQFIRRYSLPTFTFCNAAWKEGRERRERTRWSQTLTETTKLGFGAVVGAPRQVSPNARGRSRKKMASSRPLGLFRQPPVTSPARLRSTLTHASSATLPTPRSIQYTPNIPTYTRSVTSGPVPVVCWS